MNNYLEESGVVLPKQQVYVNVPAEFILNPKYTVNEKIVYIYLLGCGVTNIIGLPPKNKMAKELNINVPTLIGTLYSLEQKNGLFRIEKEKDTYKYYLGEINKDGDFSDTYLDTIKYLLHK